MAGKRPVELRSMGGWFLVFVLALSAACAWAVYDETVTRRPWKETQAEFNRLELADVRKKLEDAEAALAAPETSEKISAIKAELDSAKKDLTGEQYKDMQKKEAELHEKSEKARQKLIFLRSEHDEAFYLWKTAARDGDLEKARSESQRFDRLGAEIAEREKEFARIGSELDATQTRLGEIASRAGSLEKQLESVTADADRLRARRAGIQARKIGVEQILVPELDAVDRCITCHPAIERDGFDGQEWHEPYRTHPAREKILGKVHPPDKFGCTVCHGGQGPQLKGVGRNPFDHGRSDPYWEKPLLDGPFIQSSCRLCHPEEWVMESAPVLTRGKRTFADLGCYGCHLTSGFEKARRIGPSLTGIKTKVTPGWLLVWIQRPRLLRPATRMPNPWPEVIEKSLSKEDRKPFEEIRERESRAIAAFLLDASSAEEVPPLVGGTADPARGKSLFIDRGCAGCHRPTALNLPPLASSSSSKDYGPDLSDLGNKTHVGWIETYLADPRAVYAESRMPNLELAPDDRRDLAAFLISLRVTPYLAEPGDLIGATLVNEGRRLAEYYGCMGCHEIRGLSSAQKVGPELDGFGEKIPALLSFGETVSNPKNQTWVNWTLLKLGSPRLYRTEKISLKMPDNELAKDDIEALAVFLKSLATPPNPDYVHRLSRIDLEKARGDRLLSEYNCRGCHLLDGEGGDLRAMIRDPGLFPPDLAGIGAKLQPEWMFQFLKFPSVLRPWLKTRMPRFGFTDEEASAFVSYFMARAGREDLFVDVPAFMSPSLYNQTALAFVQLKCVQCHRLSTGAVSLSDLAPDMALTRHRLRPSWVLNFIRDPQSLMPGTKMPTFFPLEDDEDPDSMMTPLPAWMSGDAQGQVKAIRDFLYLFSSQAELEQLEVKLKEAQSGLPTKGTGP